MSNLKSILSSFLFHLWSCFFLTLSLSLCAFKCVHFPPHQCDQIGLLFNYLGDLLITLAIIFGKRVQNEARFGQFFKWHHPLLPLGPLWFPLVRFFPKQPGLTAPHLTFLHRIFLYFCTYVLIKCVLKRFLLSDLWLCCFSSTSQI